MILTLISQTIVIVFFLTFSFGPAFFALINASMKQGYRTASMLAFGVVLSDFVVSMLIIVLVSLGAENLIQDEKSQRFMGILAGIILIVFGALHFRDQGQKNENATIEVKSPSVPAMILKGFFLNSLNPAVWLLWLGNVTAVSRILSFSALKMIIYFSITLVLVLLVELAKIRASGRLKKVLTAKTMHVVNIITGGLLIIFGVVLIYNHFFDA